jgi:ABC-type transporter Mla subunit MlaD
MAKLPGLDGVVGGVTALLQAQTEALAALPGTVTALGNAVRGLADTVTSARDTIVTVNRLATRLDGLVDELEEPLRALAPGLTRLAAVLDDPVLEEVPATVRQIQADILPVLRTLAETHERVAVIAGSTERIMTFVDETSRTLAGLPAAALLGRRRTAPKIVLPPEAHGAWGPA